MKYALFVVHVCILVCGIHSAFSSDTAVQRFTTKQALASGGVIYTFDAYQAGFSISSGTVTFRSTFPMTGTIDLSSGVAPYTPRALVLQQDWVLNDLTTFSSIGNITGAGYALVLPKSVTQFPVHTTTTNCTFSNVALVCNGDFTWQAPSITFSGDSIINGQGNCITLDSDISITVATGATLLVQDVMIKNLSGAKIACSGTGSITLKNVTIVLDDDYAFGAGSLSFGQNVRIVGSGKKFIYSSAQVSTVMSGATLLFDRGTLFSYASTTNDRFQLVDSTAHLFLNNATLQVAAGATAGLLLSAGTILVDGLSYLDDPTNKGINLGASVAVHVAPAATLQQGTGALTIN